jgi:hypothetical protein
MADENTDLNSIQDKGFEEDIGNNNPGNIRPAGSDTGFMSYDSPSSGLKAMADDLTTKTSKKSHVMASQYGPDYTPTLTNVISTYAPPSENNTAAYIDHISQATGITPDQELTPDDVNKIMPVMIEHEKGQKVANQFKKLLNNVGTASIQDKGFQTDEPEDKGFQTDPDSEQLSSAEQTAKTITNTPGLKDLGETWLSGAYGAAQGAGLGMANYVVPGLQALGETAIKGVNAGLNAIHANLLPDKWNNAIQNANVIQDFNKSHDQMSDYDTQAEAIHPDYYNVGKIAGAVAPLLYSTAGVLKSIVKSPEQLTIDAADKIRAKQAVIENKNTDIAFNQAAKANPNLGSNINSAVANQKLLSKAADAAEAAANDPANQIYKPVHDEFIKKAAEARATADQAAEQINLIKEQGLNSGMKKVNETKAALDSNQKGISDQAADLVSTVGGAITNGFVGGAAGHFLAPAAKFGINNVILPPAKLATQAGLASEVGDSTGKIISQPNTINSNDLDKYANELGPYYTGLKAATTQGDNALAVHQFLLQQRDPNFNLLMNNIQNKKSQDNQ